MIRPGLLASLKAITHAEERDGNPTVLRDTVLQSQTTLRIQGWSKGNLLRSVTHRSIQTFSVFVFDIEHHQGGEILLHLATRETLSLREILQADAARASPLSVFVLYCNESSFEAVRQGIAKYSSKNSIFIISSGDDHFFYFALACELTHWWNLKSCLLETVTFEHIGCCIANLAEAYPGTGAAKHCTVAVTSTFERENNAAWNGGVNYAPEVDIDSFRRGARGEQLDDTLKRMSDSANHPREQHSPSEERMISSQGLFWLSEASLPDQMPAWLRDTRLFRESHPYLTERLTEIRVRALDRPDVSFVRSLVTHFVDVPGGSYRFGSNDESLESEPPAAPVDLKVNAFSIMRGPVSYGFLRAFIECDVPVEMNDLPVTGLSFFDVQFVANLCTSLFQRYGSHQQRRRIRLPTEYQWEAAARGTAGTNYPWGAAFDEHYANYGMRIGHTTRPGMFSPNGDSAFGCQDMAGNVREWTRSYGGTRGVDWTTHEQSRVEDDRKRIVDSSRLIIKGGSYSYSSECLQSWVRNTQIANREDSQTGFRFVLED